MIDNRINPLMVSRMREPQILKEKILRNEAYCDGMFNFRVINAAYSLLGITNHPLFVDGPGDTALSDGERMTFRYAPVAVLLAEAGFTVEVIEGRSGKAIGTLRVLPQSTIVDYVSGHSGGIEAVLE